MRISLLQKREDFEKNLCEALGRFLTTKHGVQHDVKWLARNECRGQSAAGGQLWLCNAYINAIFRPDCPRRNLEPLIREFSRSPSALRRPAQRLYVWLATGSGASMLRTSGLQVKPPAPDTRNWVILGGNTKIRVLDRDDGCSYVIAKSSACDSTLENELRLREAAQSFGVPAPNILSRNRQGRWIAEQYIIGTPINRLPSRSRRAALLEEVVAPLERYSASQRRSTTGTEYAADLVTKTQADARQDLDGHVSDRVQATMQRLLELAANSDGPVTLAQSHGDLQAANVLDTGNGAALIDWEYAHVRQMRYDALTWCLATRKLHGLGNRLTAFVHDAWEAPVPSWNSDSSMSTRQQRALAATLLGLEELQLIIAGPSSPIVERAYLSAHASTLLDELDDFSARVAS